MKNRGILGVRGLALLLAILLPATVSADVGSSLRWAATSLNGMTGGVISGSVELRNPSDLSAEYLGQPSTFAAGWTVTGDFAIAGANAVYTHATGVGTLTQTAADAAANGGINWATSLAAWFLLAPTISGVAAGGPSCTVTNAFASAAVVVPMATGSQQFQAKKTVAVGDFVIFCTSTAGQNATIESLSLKRIGGDLIVNGDTTLYGKLTVPAGTTAAPSITGGSATSGFGFSGGNPILPGLISSGSLAAFASGNVFYMGGYLGFPSATFLYSSAAATLQLGQADSAAPVSQTLKAQGGVGTNIAGGNLTITSGGGTGNATGSTLYFQTPSVGGSGTGAQTMVTRVQVNNAGLLSTSEIYATTRVFAGAMALSGATMTAETSRSLQTATHSYTWTNAMVVALGASTTGDIPVATLPAKTELIDAQVVILTADTSANALTVACGRTGATYIDYITAQDAKAAANTVYGDAAAERGTNLTGYDLPSYTATTTINCHFVKTTTNLDTVTGSTGRVILTTRLLP